MPVISKPGRAIVVGGSLSGLLVGLQLRQNGWAVDIYERVESELAGRGAGIVAQPELIERLKRLGLNVKGLGVEITTRKMYEASGRILCTCECPQVLTAWERVYRILREAFPDALYHRGKGVARFEQSERSVKVTLTDGASVEVDLVIGADGIRSTVRQQCLPELNPLYAGYVAWRALIAESAFSPAAHRELFNYMSFCLPPGEQFLGYPVTGAEENLQPGHRRYNIVWYRPAEEKTKLQWLLTDERGETHSISIPPPLIRREAIVEMHADAERLIAPQLLAIARLIDGPILQPIYDLETPRMAFGRVAIIGDAAFVARPHVAAGVAKAADDAAALAAALAAESNLPAALKRFEAERLPVGRRIIERARHLGAYLQATQTAEERARSERHNNAQSVLTETAVLDFLHQ